MVSRLPDTAGTSMSAPLEPTTTQHFETERFSRAIDNTTDVDALRSIAKQLLHAWQGQKAATNWAIRQQLGR